MKHYSLFIVIISISLISCGQSSSSSGIGYNYKLSDNQWKQKLTPEQFDVMRRQGTETAFTGKYWDNKKHGKYFCSACKHPLFSSDTKYKSGTGWPSFFDVLDNGVGKGVDNSLGSSRNEIHCANCGSHLGHVFEDGPKPTGLRYCINSVALVFEQE